MNNSVEFDDNLLTIRKLRRNLRKWKKYLRKDRQQWSNLYGTYSKEFQRAWPFPSLLNSMLTLKIIKNKNIFLKEQKMWYRVGVLVESQFMLMTSRLASIVNDVVILTHLNEKWNSFLKCNFKMNWANPYSGSLFMPGSINGH